MKKRWARKGAERGGGYKFFGILLLFVIGIIAITAAPIGTKPIPGHNGSQIQPGTILGDRLADNLNLTGNVSINDAFYVKGSNVGIGKTNPTKTLDVTGEISASEPITITKANGTAPLNVTSTTLNTNLNADLLDGSHATAFIKTDGTANPTNIPAFSAKSAASQSDVTGDGTAATLICTVELFDQGNNYNPATGIFTAPATGKYRFSAYVLLGEIGVNHNFHNIQLVTTNRIYSRSYNFAAGANPFTHPGNLAIDVLADMDEGETAYVRIVINGGTKIVDLYGDAGEVVYSFFSGELVT